MTTHAFPALTRTESRLQAITAPITEFFAGIREGREMLRRYEALSRLSDKELARLGISRMDVPRAAMFGVKGV
jgi:uncharacterized protein YjiS (DUF1127 family)